MSLAQRHSESASYRHIAVAPLTGVIGAEITGLDLTRPLEAEAQREIRQAFQDYLVVYFPDQKPLTPEQHVAFAGIFGPIMRILHIRHIEGHPDVQIISREANESGTYVIGENWHTDSTYLEKPPLAVVMRGVDLPPVGGDTAFANLYLAYETLSPKMREILGGLNAVHSATRLFGAESKKREKRYDIPEMDQALGDREMIHPVIHTHPHTGRKVVFVNRTFTRRFEGMTEDESRPLLEFLYNHCSRFEYTCRVRWRPNQILVWDNRATWHKAIFDYPGYRRYMERVTVGGERPE